MKALFIPGLCLLVSHGLFAQRAAPELVVTSVSGTPHDSVLTVRASLRHHGPPTRYFKPYFTPDGGEGQAACFTMGWLVVSTPGTRPDTVGFFPCYLTSHVICPTYTRRNTLQLREGQQHDFVFRVPLRRLHRPYPPTLLFGMALAYDNLANHDGTCAQYPNKLRVYDQRITTARPLRVQVR